MTDMETLKALFEKRDIPFELNNTGIYDKVDGADQVLWLTNDGNSQNITGYSYFCCAYYFNNEGALLKVGIWE